MYCSTIANFCGKNALRAAIATAMLAMVPVAMAQVRETTSSPDNQRQLPQLQTDLTQKDTSPAGGEKIHLGRASTVGVQVEIHGPFREGKNLSRQVAAHATSEDNTIGPPQRLESHGRALDAGSKIPGREATIELAGPSVMEALSKLPHPSGNIKPFSNSFAESLLPESQRSPAVTTLWPKGAFQNNGGDPQIAVSRTTVAVLSWSELFFYDKSGTPVFNTDMPTLFADVLTGVNASLNLNPAVANDPNYTVCPTPTNCDVGDARIVFDAIHNRWAVVATAKNAKAGDPSRRTKFLLAVSLDEDPAHGFNTYFANATPDDGACNSLDIAMQCPGTWFTPGNAGDYPSVGVSDKHYMFTVHADHPGGSWAYLLVVNAQDMMNGAPHPHGHAFWGWDIGDGESASNVTMPVVNTDKISPFDKGMIVDTEGDTVNITTVSNDDPPVLSWARWQMPEQQAGADWPQKGSLRQINDHNVGTKPITAFEINGNVVAALNDCRAWWLFLPGATQACAPSIHLFSTNVQSLPVAAAALKFNRVIGWRNSVDDDPNDVVAYGMPGIAMNKDGNIAVVYTRSSPLLYPEVRYSTWHNGELDIRPSRVLRKGDGPILASGGPDKICSCLQTNNCPEHVCDSVRTDTAGVALDPFDRTAIWMAHDHANSSGGYSVTVGKVFGRTYPDLTVPKVDFSLKSVHTGDPLHVTFTVHNGGDGPASNVKAEVRLVSLMNPSQPRIALGEDSIPDAIASGASVDRVFDTKVPWGTAPGRYAVEVEAQIRGGDATEYSVDNNTGQARVLEVLPLPPSALDPNKAIFLLPDNAFPGGLLTGVVIGPDDKPVANTPVEIAGGVAAELTGQVIGETSPCPPDNPNCQPEKTVRKALPGGPPEPPVDCAAVLQNVGATTARSTPAAASELPSAAAGGQGVRQLVTDAAGRFSVCVSLAEPELQVNLPGGATTRIKSDRDPVPTPERPPDFFQPGQKVSVNGLISDPQATQGDRKWLLPVVHAWSPDGRRMVSALRTPQELAPGPAQLSYTGSDGQRRTSQGTVFKILRAYLDHSQLHSNQGASFEYEVQFASTTSQSLCVEMHIDGPIVLLQAPPEMIAIDAAGSGHFGGKIRATQVTPGVAVPFNINPHIHLCGN